MASSQVSRVPRRGFQFGGGEGGECIGKSAARECGDSEIRQSIVEVSERISESKPH
jgi:hypothetical protein